MDDGPNNIGFQILIIVCLVLMNGFFALAEMALVSVRRTRIKQLVESGDRRAITVQKLLDKPTSFMSTVQIGVTLVGFLASAFAAVSIAKLPATWLMMLGLSKSNSMQISVIAVTVLVGFFTLVVGEIAPKSLAMQHAEKYALKFAGVIRFLSILGMPAVKIVSFCSDLLVKPFGCHVKFSAPILTQEELKMLVETGEEEGVIELEEREMIHSIFDFTDTVAKEVMVPRTDMHCANVNVTLDELTDMITLTGHSRIPIYEDNVDNIIGVVHAKDLIPVLSKDKKQF